MRRVMFFVTYGRRWLIIVTETKGIPPARALWPVSRSPISSTHRRPACSPRPGLPVLRLCDDRPTTPPERSIAVAPASRPS